jgi:hypothetical protein
MITFFTRCRSRSSALESMLWTEVGHTAGGHRAANNRFSRSSMRKDCRSTTVRDTDSDPVLLNPGKKGSNCLWKMYYRSKSCHYTVWITHPSVHDFIDSCTERPCALATNNRAIIGMSRSAHIEGCDADKDGRRGTRSCGVITALILVIQNGICKRDPD